jgi:hypothetical protein
MIIFHLLDLLYYGPTNCIGYHLSPTNSIVYHLSLTYWTSLLWTHELAPSACPVHKLGLSPNCTLQKIGFLVESPGKQTGGVALQDLKILGRTAESLNGSPSAEDEAQGVGAGGANETIGYECVCVCVCIYIYIYILCI